MIRGLAACSNPLSRQRSHRQFKHPTTKGTVTIAGKPSKDLDDWEIQSIRKQARGA
ncbi:MAG TPA: type II toxin-antitoxin system HicA family toxin [Chloroflexota bacterium]|nr:type II toxin-antitoxin system HicA family toxin [Chloroflexota bacterium]